jgi:hypothetical protein
MAAGSPSSIRRVAVRGYNLLLDQFAAFDVIGERIALFKSECAARGAPGIHKIRTRGAQQYFDQLAPLMREQDSELRPAD